MQASSIVVMDGLGETKDGTVSLSPLLGLQDVGLRYTLTAATGIVVAATAEPPRDPVTVLMDLPGTQVGKVASGRARAPHDIRHGTLGLNGQPTVLARGACAVTLDRS